jgi:hypothetical protein
MRRKLSDGLLIILVCVLLPISGIVGFKMAQDFLYPVEVAETENARN